MDKEGVRKCVGNVACVLKDLLHDMDKGLASKYALRVKLLENNIHSMKKLLGLDNGGEDEK